jgi:hypothetical protein
MKYLRIYGVSDDLLEVEELNSTGDVLSTAEFNIDDSGRNTLLVITEKDVIEVSSKFDAFGNWESIGKDLKGNDYGKVIPRPDKDNGDKGIMLATGGDRFVIRLTDQNGYIPKELK